MSPAGAESPTPTTVTSILSDGSNTGASLTESPNAKVTDTATLAGAGVSTASGTVTYLIFSNNKCTKAVDDSQVTVTDGVVPPSPPVTFSKAGIYYWTAVYSGDANDAGSVGACGSEVETVAAGTIVNTATDSATCQTSGSLTFDPPLVTGGTASETATLALKVKSCTVSGSPSVTIAGVTWHGTMLGSADACAALSALPALSSTLVFKTAPAMRSDSSAIAFGNVDFNGSTVSATAASADGAGSTAPFQGSDQGASSGLSLTTSVTATQAATTCSKTSRGLKSLKVVKGTLTLQ